METSNYKVIECPYYVISNEQDMKKFEENHGPLGSIYEHAERLYPLPFIAGWEPGFKFQQEAGTVIEKEYVDHKRKEILRYVESTLD